MFNPINAVDIDEATYKSCYIVTELEISSAGHLLIFGIDLGNIYFQHAILIIESIKNLNIEVAHTEKFQNYNIYIGNDSDYTQNSKCAEGPFMQTEDHANYHTWTKGDDVYPDIWNSGKEIWCNLEGRFMHVVADFAHLAG